MEDLTLRKDRSIEKLFFLFFLVLIPKLPYPSLMLFFLEVKLPPDYKVIPLGEKVIEILSWPPKEKKEIILRHHSVKCEI